MLSEFSISKFIVCAQTFVEIPNVQKEVNKFQQLLGEDGERLKEFILRSRESPAFSTFISDKIENITINENNLVVWTSVEIRLCCLVITIRASLNPFPKVTFGQSFQFIEETKKIIKEKLGNWKDDDAIEFAVLIEFPSDIFDQLNKEILEAGLPKLTGCDMEKKHTYSLSYSKLGEIDEKTDLVIMSFKEFGLLKEVWIIGPPFDDGMIENRARWWSIVSLTRFMLQYLKRQYDLLLPQIVKLEKEVEKSTNNFPRLLDAEVTTRFYEKLTEFRKRFIQIRYMLTTFHELFECTIRNMDFVNWGVRIIPSSGGPMRVDEKLISCNDKVLFLPGFLIMEASGSTWSDIPKNIDEMVNSGTSKFINARPTLEKGFVEQMKRLLELIQNRVEERHDRAEKLVNRLNSHINDIMKVVEAETALLLQNTQTMMAKSTAVVERNFGILTLIFAVFSVGQVVSAFTIWYWGSIESTNPVTLENLTLAVGVTIIVMIAALIIALIAYFRSFK